MKAQDIDPPAQFDQVQPVAVRALVPATRTAPFTPEQLLKAHPVITIGLLDSPNTAPPSWLLQFVKAQSVKVPPTLGRR
jgi:hypothetical protein